MCLNGTEPRKYFVPHSSCSNIWGYDHFSFPVHKWFCSNNRLRTLKDIHEKKIKIHIPSTSKHWMCTAPGLNTHQVEMQLTLCKAKFSSKCTSGPQMCDKNGELQKLKKKKKNCPTSIDTSHHLISIWECSQWDSPKKHHSPGYIELHPGLL